MKFEEDDIPAQKTKTEMFELAKQGVDLRGSEYNRVFEVIYKLYQIIENIKLFKP